MIAGRSAGMSTTSVSTLLARFSRSLRSPPARCPVTKATDAATPRWVTGIPAAAGAASAALTPGITRTGTPARRSASTSSPPRPKRNGSPPFSRTTRSPARAAAVIASLMSAWVADRRPERRHRQDECGAAQPQHLRSDEGVVEDDVGVREDRSRTHGEEIRVARSGSGEDDLPDWRRIRGAVRSLFGRQCHRCRRALLLSGTSLATRTVCAWIGLYCVGAAGGPRCIGEAPVAPQREVLAATACNARADPSPVEPEAPGECREIRAVHLAAHPTESPLHESTFVFTMARSETSPPR